VSRCFDRALSLPRARGRGAVESGSAANRADWHPPRLPPWHPWHLAETDPSIGAATLASLESVDTQTRAEQFAEAMQSVRHWATPEIALQAAGIRPESCNGYPRASNPRRLAPTRLISSVTGSSPARPSVSVQLAACAGSRIVRRLTRAPDAGSKRP
jgi:hypothetical protein